MADKKTANANIERITDNDTRAERLQGLINQIPQYVEDFCLQYNVDNLTTASANIFNALLMDIGAKLIKPNKDVLKTRYKVNNAYDLLQVDTLLDEYIKLSRIYDNPVTILGFASFSDIPREIIQGWQHAKIPHANSLNMNKEYIKSDAEQTLTGNYIYEKIVNFEESTTLQCRKYNDLRVIARLNRITGGAYRDYQQVDTSNTAQQLSAGDIANKYGVESAVVEALPVK